MVSRRWLLRGAVIASIGLATAGLGVATGASSMWRRLVAMSPTNRHPALWTDSPVPTRASITIGSTPLRPIGPLIYGVSVATPDQLHSTGARLNRWGGNPNSRYNWVDGSAWNAARDWEFRNYGSRADQPIRASSAADQFVSDNRANGASSWITIPGLGWVARDGDSSNASIGVPADGGPPIAPDSDAIGGYDPTANRGGISVRSLARKPGPFTDPPDPRSDPVYQDEWVHHLVSRFGPASAGGVQYYAVDNEPDLWSTTHTDVHPVQPDYAELLATFIDYASAIKDVDSTASLTGPSLSGWTSLFYSARDRGNDNFRAHADRHAHGDVPFLPWWLQQVRAYEVQHDRRLLDAVDVHYYPQANGVFGPLGDEATQRRRLRSTRSLWDPTYVDESWIGEAVNLIPRLREWRDQYAPGTQLAIGEWNWGADDTLNGALAIANVLGIFGREGVDLASYWTSPPAGSPGAHAFALFTNYDGAGHGFGDQSLPVTSSAPDDVAAYASRESTNGDRVLVVLNHRPDAALPVIIRPSSGAPASWYLYDASGHERIRDAGSVSPQDGELRLTLPPESLSIVRIPS